MNKKEFYNEFKELCEYYNDKTYENKKLTKMYYEKVKDISLKEFQDMCNKIILESKYMPRVADFGKDYNTFLLEVMHKNRKYSEEYLESLYDNI